MSTTTSGATHSPPPTPEEITAALSQRSQQMPAQSDDAPAVISESERRFLEERARAGSSEEALEADTITASPTPVIVPPPAAHPPARIAGVAGDPFVPLDYDPGRRGRPMDRIQTIAVPIRAGDTADPVGPRGSRLRAPADLDSGQFKATVARISATMKQWVANVPHQLEGEEAAVVAFFRQLNTRDRTRLEAQQMAGGTGDDAIEAATHLPPPEAHVLTMVREQVRQVLDAQEGALKAAGLSLTGSDQLRVDELRRTLDL